MENRIQSTGRTSEPCEGNESIHNTNEAKIGIGEGEEAYDGVDTKREHDGNEDGKNEEYGEGKEEENNVDDILKPYVGMVFDSEEHAFQFYNNYAREKGFSIRRGHVRRSMKNNAIISRKLFCSKEGFREEKYKRNVASKKKHFGETRIGCQARLVVKLQADNGTWVVTIFEEKHNHKFETQRKRYLQPPARNINESQGVFLIDKMNTETVKTNLMVHYLSKEAGGIKNANFVERDAVNGLNTKHNKDVKKGDAQAVLDYFIDMQMENPNFFYAVQLNSDGQMTNFFWADVWSRMDYGYFGDVVCIDTTYGTNRYKMPFVPIVGVNHHLQTSYFGGAVILDETEASFVWLLETWMKAMNGCHTKTIFTNQDSTITGAITCVLPHAHHRFCLWHVFQNAQKHLGHLYRQSSSFAGDFSKCIYDNETVEEFESGWESLLTTYNLHKNEWMSRLYGMRQQWVPIYSHGIFCADMSTTQRSESIDKFFKDFLKRDMVLQDFVKAVDRALVSRREEEIKADFYDNQVLPPLLLHMQIEEDAGKIYTTSVFKKFQEELILSLRFMCEKIDEDGTTSIFKCWLDNRQCIVKLHSHGFSGKCSCQRFEYTGILCRHVLKVFIVTNVVRVQPQHILKRWTRDAKCGVVKNEESEQMQADCQMSLSLRYSSLCRQGMNITVKGASSTEVYKVAMHWLQKTLLEVENALKRVSTESTGSNKRKRECSMSRGKWNGNGTEDATETQAHEF